MNSKSFLIFLIFTTVVVIAAGISITSRYNATTSGFLEEHVFEGFSKKFSNVDVCFVVPSSAKKAYQKLANVYSAIEPPTWALLLAQALRKKSYECVILDFDADPKNIDQSVKEIADTKPKLVIFVLYY